MNKVDNIKLFAVERDVTEDVSKTVSIFSNHAMAEHYRKQVQKRYPGCVYFIKEYKLNNFHKFEPLEVSTNDVVDNDSFIPWF